MKTMGQRLIAHDARWDAVLARDRRADGQFVYAVWGDNRSGFLGTWYGRVPLTAY